MFGCGCIQPFDICCSLSGVVSSIVFIFWVCCTEITSEMVVDVKILSYEASGEMLFWICLWFRFSYYHYIMITTFVNLFYHIYLYSMPEILSRWLYIICCIDYQIELFICCLLTNNSLNVSTNSPNQHLLLQNNFV